MLRGSSGVPKFWELYGNIRSLVTWFMVGTEVGRHTQVGSYMHMHRWARKDPQGVSEKGAGGRVVVQKEQSNVNLSDGFP